MSVIEEISPSPPVVCRFEKYLNGPLGRPVLENLEEGESFILQTSEHVLRITKRNNRAEVNLIQAR
ncbi:MAG: hypothetical protein BAJATHORv1_10468 [Candidatus Thorarchaeota archaeon]|nr:MAG: hypothetical protein BAJATHORv1_10468 [Candidatus Thorarchaeota archaeon]